MKDIKYLALFIATAGLFIGCSDDDDLSMQNQNKPKPTVTLAAGTVTDEEFTFTLTASDNASQYAYAVFEGKDNTAPIAHDIVIDEVSGAIQTGAFNLSDAVSQTVKVACESAADYQVFAAAITSTGLLGEVVSLDIYVDDTIAPEIDDFETDGNTLKIIYSEPVVVGKTGKATVSYIQWGIGNMLAPVDIPMENISTEGNVATIVCEKPGNGAGYIVNITEGLFEDPSGNKSAAVNSGWDNNKLDYVGFGWDDKTVDFPIEESYFVVQTDEDDYNQPTATVNLVFPFMVLDNEKTNAAQVIYYTEEGIMYLNTTYTLDNAEKTTVKVALPQVPTIAFDVQFAAGAFYDVWGNESASFTVSTDELRYSNLPVAIKPGNYSISYTSGGDKVVNQESGTPFAANLEKIGYTQYVLHANWFNWSNGFIMPDLVGDVDFDNNRIVFDGRFLYNGTIYGRPAFGSGFYPYDSEGTYSLVFWGGGEGYDPIVASFNDEGYLTDISYLEYGIHDSEGYYMAPYDFITDGKMTFEPDDAAETVTTPGFATAYKAFSTPLAGFSKMKK